MRNCAVFASVIEKTLKHMTTDTIEQLVITPELLKRYDVPGPRYTSYPTADRFVEAFGEVDYLQALAQRNVGAIAVKPLSIYVHIPFCDTLCYYCGCNKIVTKHHERARPYLDSLFKEIELVARQFEKRQRVSQIHFGGGTPTFLSDDELTEVMSRLRGHFGLLDTVESTIEVDPRTVTAARLQHLWDIGFNRLSFGIQDFNPQVQEAVHRVQITESVFDLMRDAREIGFTSLNADLIYGLPHQTLESFAQTLDDIARLRPDRIAVYGYAHLPRLFKPQRMIHSEDLPPAATRLQLLSESIQRLQERGYEYIGIDHFALPDDSLSVAKRQGHMHRNFQGYSTHADCDLVGLGVSAISKVGAVYSQNTKDIEDYMDLVNQGHLPVLRGVALDRDDIVRRAVISAIMCQGEVVYESINLAYLIDFKTYFSHELQLLEHFVNEGLMEVDDNSIRVTALGWYFVRALAMMFDKYLQADRTRERFSRII